MFNTTQKERYHETYAQPASLINTLLTLANNGDKDHFNLLNDSNVLEGNLDNEIHPIFRHPNLAGKSPHMKRALQLASLFLTTDSLLEFFIPLTFGTTHTETTEGKDKTYKLYKKQNETDYSKEQQIILIKDTLACLAHCIDWDWLNLPLSIWARTKKLPNGRPHHGRHCPVKASVPGEPFFFGSEFGVRIEVSGTYLAHFFNETSGYVTRSRCDQFRLDFHLAITLCHELVHAYTIMTTGTLQECWLAHDHPKAECGFAWENFVFGSIIQPYDRTVPGIHILTHKIWQKETSPNTWYGKEWAPIPMSWTADWFRKETWERLKQNGHLAHPLPKPGFKVVLSPKIQRWLVRTDDERCQNGLELARARYAMRHELHVLTGTTSTTDTLAHMARLLILPMIDMTMAPPPQRHFNDERANIEPYLVNRECFLRESLGLIKQQKENPKTPKYLSVAEACWHTKVQNSLHGRRASPSTKMAVTVGLKYASSNEGAESKKGRNIQEPYSQPSHEFSSFYPTTLGKRVRHGDGTSDSHPNKKARTDPDADLVRGSTNKKACRVTAQVDRSRGKVPLISKVR